MSNIEGNKIKREGDQNMKKSDNSSSNGTIHSFRWKNFRCFKNTGWVNIKPLTILIGPNNSGKSSLIYPFLLLKQTMESGDITLPLKTKRKYVNVGDYKSLINQHDVRKKLVFEIRLGLQKTKKRDLKEIRESPPNVISLSFKPNDEKEIQLESFEVKDIFNRPMLKRSLLLNGAYSFDFPTKKFTKSEGEFQQIIEKSKPNHFLFDPAEVFFKIVKKIVPTEINGLEEGSELKKEGESQPNLKIDPKHPTALFLYLFILTYVQEKIKEITEKIDYIGPIRRSPQRYYERIGEKPYSVGSRGQFTPELLLRMEKERDLESVNEWLENFGVGGETKCLEYPSSELFSIVQKKTDERSETNMDDLGFGISQVLPLITQGLWMDEGRTLITEQPEIHLNPKLQVTLADFFTHMVNSGKTVILETHSEYLLLRLRALIADPDNEIKSSDVALYFVEKTNGEASIKNITIGDNGHIDGDSWPKNFFEDALDASFNLSIMQNKRKEK